MFVKKSLWDCVVCFADFIAMTKLTCHTPTAPFLFLLPLPICLLRVCVGTLLAAVLISFLPLITSEVSGIANFKKSAPTRFAAVTKYLAKEGIAVLPIFGASAPNLRSRCRPMPLYYGISTGLEATIM